jgi:hypothetical protein
MTPAAVAAASALCDFVLTKQLSIVSSTQDKPESAAVMSFFLGCAKQLCMQAVSVMVAVIRVVVTVLLSVVLEVSVAVAAVVSSRSGSNNSIICNSCSSDRKLTACTSTSSSTDYKRDPITVENNAE